MIIIADENGNQLEKIEPQIKSENWEEECYQIGCKVAKKIASQYLQETEQKLFDKCDKVFRMKDIKQRTILTRFGEIAIQRRLYKKSKDEYCFLLDEYLNWRPNQSATPSLTEAIVDSATKLSFRKVGEEVEKYTAGVISAPTVHRLLTRVSKDAINEDKKQHESWYDDCDIPPPGEGKVSILYMEADGLWVKLQREEKKHYELKSAIAYEGWERHEDDSYSLLNKKVYTYHSLILLHKR